MDDAKSAALVNWLAKPPQRGTLSGLRLLSVSTVEPSWVGLSLQLDAIGCHDARLKWVSTAAEVMTVLRHEVIDALLIQHDPRHSDWDIGNLLRAIRSSGCDDAILLLSCKPDDALAILAGNEYAELLVSPLGWDSPALLPSIQRALKSVEMRRENHRLLIANQRRLVRERDEAQHLLQQQYDIVRELELLGSELAPEVGAETEMETEATACIAHASLVAANAASRDRPAAIVPQEIKTYYQELLRTFVIMGSGNLGGEIAKLAKVLAQVGLSPRDTLALHLERVEQLVKGLGNRSTRHVMSRADLLVLELIMHIGEYYQHPDRD